MFRFMFFLIKLLFGFIQDQKMKDVQNFLILSGDQLYRMDYMKLIQVLAVSCYFLFNIINSIAYDKFHSIENNYLEDFYVQL